MRYALALAGLATLVAAAPVATSNEHMAGDKTYVSYDPYAKYDPYPKAVEDLAAKMQADAMALNMKRTPNMNMAHDTDYTKYSGYTPYSKYSPYSKAVEEEAAKMMDMERRDMLNSMHDSHVQETAELMMEAEHQKRHEMMIHVPEPVMSDKHKREEMHAECENSKGNGNMAWCNDE